MHSEFWSQGIEAEPTVASLYSARAEAFAKLNKIEDSLNDAVKVLALKDGTETEMAGAELDARQSRSRRLQMDWEEVEERAPKPYALWGVIGVNCLVFILWQDTSMRRFMGKKSQKF